MAKDAETNAPPGHEQALSRKFSTTSMFFLALSVLGTWSTAAQGLSSGLTSGGPVSVLWGLALVALCNACVAVSLGELCSSMPTALGQAYWVYRLWPGPAGRFASYLCAWVNTLGWWALSASQLAFMTSFALGMRVLFAPDRAQAGAGWASLALYLGATLAATAANLVACRRDSVLPAVNSFVGACFVGLFFVFCLALPVSVGARADLEFQPASFVFGRWINQTGWGDGVAWFTGLVQAAYGLTAFDSAVHLAEEMPAPRSNVPRVIWLSVALGAATGFVFMVACLFSIQDLDAVLDPPTGLAFADLVHGAVGLRGAAVLLSLFVFNGMGQAVSIVTTSSRLTWGFARDGGIPWGAYFSQVDEAWRVPARALWLQGGVVGLVGTLYVFSNTALEAVLSVSTVALTISYAMPILALLAAGREKLPPGEFRLGRFGPLANGVSVVYCTVTSIFFFFPSGPHPAPADMNYAVAVFGAVLVVTLGFWVFKGRHTYLATHDAAERIIEAQNAELVVSPVLPQKS